MRGHFGAERPVALRSATPAGATFARALASELADALRSVICAAARRACVRRRVQSLALSKKNSHREGGCSFFGGEERI